MPLQLSSELLHQVVALVVAEFVDEVIAGSLQIPQDQPQVAWSDAGEPIVLKRVEYMGDTRLPKPVSILSLLSASFQSRSITLRVISDALHIPIIKSVVESLEQSPWEVLQQARLKWQHSGDDAAKDPQPCSNLIRGYMILGLCQYRYNIAFHNRRSRRCRESLGAIRRVPGGFLGLFIVSRLLGVYGYEQAYMVKACSSILKEDLRVMDRCEVSGLNEEQVDIMVDTVKLVQLCCTESAEDPFTQMPGPFNGVSYVPVPLASGVISFEPLREVLEAMVSLQEVSLDRYEEAREVAQDLLDKWSTYFPHDTSPYCAPVVPIPALHEPLGEE